MVPLFMFFVVIIVAVVVLHFCGFLHKIWLGSCLEKVPVKGRSFLNITPKAGIVIDIKHEAQGSWQLTTSGIKSLCLWSVVKMRERGHYSLSYSWLEGELRMGRGWTYQETKIKMSVSLSTTLC